MYRTIFVIGLTVFPAEGIRSLFDRKEYEYIEISRVMSDYSRFVKDHDEVYLHKEIHHVEDGELISVDVTPCLYTVVNPQKRADFYRRVSAHYGNRLPCILTRQETESTSEVYAPDSLT